MAHTQRHINRYEPVSGANCVFLLGVLHWPGPRIPGREKKNTGPVKPERSSRPIRENLPLSSFGEGEKKKGGGDKGGARDKKERGHYPW